VLVAPVLLLLDPLIVIVPFIVVGWYLQWNSTVVAEAVKLPLPAAPPAASVTSVVPTVKLCFALPSFFKLTLITWPAEAVIVAGLRLKLTAVTVTACGCAAPLALGVVVALSPLLLQAASRSSGPTAARASILISMGVSFHRALINRYYLVYDRRACEDWRRRELDV
jgi:hypothetical protein